MRGGVPGRCAVQGLALEGFKIVPVLFRRASGVSGPMNDKRFDIGKFFPRTGKGIDRQQVSLYVHAESIASRQSAVIIIAFNVFFSLRFGILKM
jgi:hypothetical protein